MRKGNRTVSRLGIYQETREVTLETWVQLTKTFLKIQRIVATTVLQYELTLPQFDVLATLRFGEGTTQQELAERLLVTKGNVCGVLQRLENVGWVIRRSDPNDGRVNRLYLSASGRRKIDEVLPQHDKSIMEIFRGRERDEIIALQSLLKKIEVSA